MIHIPIRFIIPAVAIVRTQNPTDFWKTFFCKCLYIFSSVKAHLSVNGEKKTAYRSNINFANLADELVKPFSPIGLGARDLGQEVWLSLSFFFSFFLLILILIFSFLFLNQIL